MTDSYSWFKDKQFLIFNGYTWAGIAFCYFTNIPPVYWMTFCWPPMLIFHGYLGYMFSRMRKKK